MPRLKAFSELKSSLREGYGRAAQVFYIFGVILAQLVSVAVRNLLGLRTPQDHCKALVANNGTCRADGLQYWAGLGESMLTLFMVVSGGVSWDDTMRPLRAISPLAVVCMVVYIVISIFTILNVAVASDLQSC